MSGYEKAKEMRDKIAAKNVAKEEQAEKGKELAKSQLEQITTNSNLVQMYQDNATEGSENLSGQSPLLKVHKVGKSSTNTLSDGTEPQDGNFFYKPTQEEFKEVRCHILTISRGFRAPSIESEDKLVFTQILAGVFAESYLPFLMYVTGKKLNPMWEFGKVANQYTHAKPFPIPMFALSVLLSTHSEPTSDPKFGKSWVIDFEIEKNTDGTPKLVTDDGEFKFLRDHLDDMRTAISSIIASREKGEPEDTQEEPKSAMPF